MPSSKQQCARRQPSSTKTTARVGKVSAPSRVHRFLFRFPLSPAFCFSPLFSFLVLPLYGSSSSSLFLLCQAPFCVPYTSFPAPTKASLGGKRAGFVLLSHSHTPGALRVPIAIDRFRQRAEQRMRHAVALLLRYRAFFLFSNSKPARHTR